MKIKFFWTWAALQPTIDNTYFLIEDWKNKIQIDASGWLKLAQMIKNWNIYFENIFISHSDTDHFLWIFNLFRTIPQIIPKLNIHCSKEIEEKIKIISNLVLRKSLNNVLFEKYIIFKNNDNLEKRKIWDFELTPINIKSKKTEQFGFLLNYKWIKILFFWDDSTNILNRTDLSNFIWVDYFISEALVPEYQSIDWWWKTDLIKFCHSSAKQAWKIAKKIKAKNLILVHTREIKNREEELKKDAQTEFDGNIIVPKDWDEIIIK